MRAEGARRGLSVLAQSRLVDSRLFLLVTWDARPGASLERAALPGLRCVEALQPKGFDETP